jgi:hypothetical protein
MNRHNEGQECKTGCVKERAIARGQMKRVKVLSIPVCVKEH